MKVSGQIVRLHTSLARPTPWGVDAGCAHRGFREAACQRNYSLKCQGPGSPERAWQQCGMAMVHLGWESTR